MRYLHTMIRVGNLEKSLEFFQLLGFVEVSREERPQGRYPGVHRRRGGR